MTETKKDSLKKEGMAENVVSSTAKGVEGSGRQEEQDCGRCCEATQEQARADDAESASAREFGAGEIIRKRGQGLELQANQGRDKNSEKPVKLDKHFVDRLQVLLMHRGMDLDSFILMMEALGWYPMTEMENWRKVAQDFLLDAAYILQCEPGWLARHEGNSPYWID